MMASGLATTEPLTLTTSPAHYQQKPQLAAGFTGHFKAKEEKVQQALSRRRTKFAKAPWHIVWCHEHCYKAAMADVAHKLQEAAKQLGAGTVFLKKTKDYMAFLASNSSSPHVLVTNWREVKPSMEEMGKEEPSNPPLGIIVLADKDSVFHRATEWAKACRDPRMTVLPDSAYAELNTLLQTYSDRVLQKHVTVQEDSHDAIQAGNLQPVAVQKDLRGAMQALQPPLNSLSSMPGMLPCTGKADVRNMPPALQQGECRIGRPSPVVQQNPSNVQGMLAFLMEAVKNQQCAARIQHDLVQSMPEVYED